MYLTAFKINNKDTERRHFMSFDVFIVNYKNTKAYQFTILWYNFEYIPTNIYLFKVNNRNTRKSVKYVQNWH